jgi:hypothetical protein
VCGNLLAIAAASTCWLLYGVAVDDLVISAPHLVLLSIEEYAKAGVDELFVQQIGGGHDAFFEAYAKGVLPRLT